MNYSIPNIDCILYNHGILTSDLNHLLNESKSQMPKKNIDAILTKVFAGKKAFYTNKPYKQLFTAAQQKQLNHIGIKYETKTPYTNGLITLKRTNNEDIDIVAFKSFVENKTQKISKDLSNDFCHYVTMLHSVISKSYLYQLVLLQTESYAYLTDQLVFEKLNEVKKQSCIQLAILFLPEYFLATLLEPAVFLNTLAETIGLWIFELMAKTL